MVYPGFAARGRGGVSMAEDARLSVNIHPFKFVLTDEQVKRIDCITTELIDAEVHVSDFFFDAINTAW